jgi:tryptophanyl-tRNA synthetase
LSYREVKQAIFDKFMEKFGPARARREELLKQPEFVDQILKRGVEQARSIALPLVRQVRDAVGIPNAKLRMTNDE